MTDVETPDVGRDPGLHGVGTEHAEPLALAELTALVVEILGARHVMEHCPLVTASQKRARKNDRMKRDVVLADELEQLHLVPVLPPRFPLVGVIRGDRDVSDRRIEPDVDHLLLEAFDRHRDAPLEVARDRSFFQTVANPGVGHLERVLCPPASHRRLAHP